MKLMLKDAVQPVSQRIFKENKLVGKLFFQFKDEHVFLSGLDRGGQTCGLVGNNGPNI